MKTSSKQHPTTGCPSFATEQLAREHARTFGTTYTTIIHAPHKDNTKGDWFVGGECGMVRYWETLVFEGKGRDA